MMKLWLLYGGKEQDIVLSALVIVESGFVRYGCTSDFDTAAVDQVHSL